MSRRKPAAAPATDDVEVSCGHADLLRSLADRLVAAGGSAAAIALDELVESTEAHLLAVENTIALLAVLERRPAPFPSTH